MNFLTPTVQFAGVLLVAVLLLWAATFTLRVRRRRRRPNTPPKPVAAGAPWLLPQDPSLPGFAVDAVQLGDLVVRAASIVGPRHRHQHPAKPRQDAYRLAQDSFGHHLIIAVADGSTPNGRIGLGANLATTTLVSDLRRRLDQGVRLEDLTAAETFSGVAQAMVDGAQLRGIPMAALHTTLIAMIVPSRPSPRGRRVAWLAHLGNSSAWLHLGTKWQHLGGDNALENSSMLPFEPEAATASLVDLPAGATIAIATDGLANAFTTVSKGQRKFAELWRRPPAIASFVQDVDLANSGFDTHALPDDRTAVVIWCGAA